MNRKLFSIVIPTYNNASLLRQCLDSLSDQTADRASYEVIVVNDGDQNDIPDMMKSMGVNTLYLRQAHKGPAGARNLGIQKAKGEVIIFLDDDSLPTKGWLAAMINSWERYPEADGIGGFMQSAPGDGLCCRVSADIFNWFLEQNSHGRMAQFLCTCNASFKKSTLNKVGNFDEGIKLPAGEDRDLNIKIDQIGGKLLLDETILVHHDRDIRFHTFIKKYYHYGKASFEIYKRYPHWKSLPRKSYLRLFQAAFRGYRIPDGIIAVCSLLIISQAATLAGYAMAKLKSS